MELVLSGKSGIPAAELVHPDDADRFIGAVQHIYRLYMAQAISANMRQNFSTPVDSKRELSIARLDVGPKVLNATLFDPTRMRLVQNKISTIILEVLIGLVLVLSIAAYSTVRLNNILPHNPCSIAGVMSLLDGSRFCDLLYDNSVFRSRKERERLLRTWRYSLGWWDLNGRLLKNGKPIDEGPRFGVDIDSMEPSRRDSTGEM